MGNSPQQPQQPVPFNDIARHFDPMMPQEEYDQIRSQYFHQVVMPRIPEGYSITATWNEFLKQTERPKLQTPGREMETQLGIAATSAARNLLAPARVIPQMKKYLDHLDQKQAALIKLARASGQDVNPARILGAFTGMGISLAALGEVAEPLAGALIPEAETASKGIQLAQRMASGGLSFGTYSGLSAKNGDRWTAGLKGFALGAGVEGVFGSVSLLRTKGVPKPGEAATEAARGEVVPPQVDEPLSKKVEEDFKVAKQEGRPAEMFQQNPRVRNILLNMRDQTGRRVEVNLVPGSLDRDMNIVKGLLKEGGSLESIHYNPNETSEMANFVERWRNDLGITQKYEKPIIIRTAPGQAQKVADKATSEGLASTPMGDDKVEVHFLNVEHRTPEEGPPSTELMSMGPEPKQLPPGKMTRERALELLKEYNMPVERADIDAMMQAGEPAITRAFEVAKRARSQPDIMRLEDQMNEEGLQGFEITPKPKARLTIPPRERVIISEDTAPTIQEAMARSGLGETLYNPAGKTPVDVQLRNIDMAGFNKGTRLMGSIEDVPMNQVSDVIDELRQKGFMSRVIRGWDRQNMEVVYFKPPMTMPEFQRIDTLTEDYDNFISQQRGDTFNSEGKPTQPVGPAAHERLGRAFGVPEEEIGNFLERLNQEQAGGGAINPRLNFKRTPASFRGTMALEDMNRIFGPGQHGAAAATIPPDIVKQELSKIGYNVDNITDEQLPYVVIGPETGKDSLYHENLHVGVAHSEVRLSSFIPRSLRQAADAKAIADGLKKGFPELYGRMGMRGILEEVFAHTAEAVRFLGDESKEGVLSQAGKDAADNFRILVQMDTSARDLMDMLNGMAERLQHSADLAPDSVGVTQFKRRLKDILRRTAPEGPSSELTKQAVDMADGSYVFDPKTGKWTYTHADGTQEVMANTHAFYNELEKLDFSDMSPSISASVEHMGVRGPGVPEGMEPTGREPMPEILPREPWMGMSAISALFRPTLNWAATVQERLDQMTLGMGKRIPILDTMRAIDDKIQTGGKWLTDKTNDLVGFFQDVPAERLHGYYRYLTHAEEDQPAAAEEYKLNAQDVQRLDQIQKWIRQFDQDTGLNTERYLRDTWPKLSAFNYQPEIVWGRNTNPEAAGQFERMVRWDHTINPEDTNLGRFLYTVMKQGYQKKFIGEDLDDFLKIINTKDKEGNYLLGVLRYPLKNYHDYLKGIPDISQRYINEAIGNFERFFTRKAKEMNPYLPSWAKLPEEVATPRAFLNRFLILMYAGGLALRPAIAVRDALQVFSTTLPVLGPVRFARALAKAMTSEGWQFADSQGALLGTQNIGAMYGDMISEAETAGKSSIDRLVRLSNKLLAPNRWGHNVARSITYLGEYFDALDAINDYRAGRINISDFMDRTSIRWLDKPDISRIMGRVGDQSIPAQDVAREMGLRLVDLTQWPYRPGTQPMLLRSGAGRILGQYGIWPLNYADFLRRIVRKTREDPKWGLRIAALWAASNYSAVASLHSFGADAGNWFFASPSGFSGGPSFDLALDMLKAPEETQEGRQARRRILEYPLQFVPSSVELKAVLQAIEQNEPLFKNGVVPGPGLIRILGFRPIPELEQDETLQQHIRQEAGFGKGKPY